jgi:hypothetical protein
MTTYTRKELQAKISHIIKEKIGKNVFFANEVTNESRQITENINTKLIPNHPYLEDIAEKVLSINKDCNNSKIFEFNKYIHASICSIASDGILVGKLFHYASDLLDIIDNKQHESGVFVSRYLKSIFQKHNIDVSTDKASIEKSCVYAHEIIDIVAIYDGPDDLDEIVYIYLRSIFQKNNVETYIEEHVIPDRETMEWVNSCFQEEQDNLRNHEADNAVEEKFTYLH